MLRKLRIKFVCITMIIVLAILCAMFALVLSFTRQSLERESIRMMQTVATVPLAPPRPGERPQAVRLPYFILRTGRQGEVMVTGGDDFDLSDEDVLREIVAAANAREEQTGVLRKYDLRFYKTDGPGPSGVVFADLSSEKATMRNLVYNCLDIGIISLGVFFVISLLLARWAMRPVARAWEQQRQFVADASHELKTPLTVILTNAELLRDPACSQERKDRCTENILITSHKMKGLVESLLELARVESDGLRPEMAAVEMSRAVSEGLLPFEPLFYERQLALESDIAPNITVRGNESALRQMLDILLDNALKYASAHGQVRVSLKKQGYSCRLSVASTGPAIPEEERKKIFTRFYRVEKARSADGSYGIGLSIAWRIVREHRGRIWVESRDGVNCFVVQLPLLGMRKETDR